MIIVKTILNCQFCFLLSTQVGHLLVTMVSLKTPPVPSPMSRADLSSVEAYIKYLELQIEYGRMKEAIKRMEEEGEKVTETGVDAAEETIVEDVRGGEEAVEEEEEENGVETMFLKGHTNAQNPGKLVIGSKQRFFVNNCS